MTQEVTLIEKRHEIKLGTEKILEIKMLTSLLSPYLIPDLAKIVYEYWQKPLSLYLTPVNKLLQLDVLNGQIIGDEKVIDEAPPGIMRWYNVPNKSGDYLLVHYQDRIVEKKAKSKHLVGGPADYILKYHTPTETATIIKPHHDLYMCSVQHYDMYMALNQNNQLYSVDRMVHQYNKDDDKWDESEMFTHETNRIIHTSTNNGIYGFEIYSDKALFFDFKTREVKKIKSMPLGDFNALTISDKRILLINNTRIFEYRPHEDDYSCLVTDMKLPIDIETVKTHFAYHLGVLYMVGHKYPGFCLYYLEVPFNLNTWQGPITNFLENVMLAC